jgi:hypothetical protein
MSALKTVERTQNIKVLEKQLNAVMRDFANASNELQTAYRDLDIVSNKLNTMTAMREFQTSRNPFGALQGEQLKKVEMLDGMRDSLMQKCGDLTEMQNILEGQLADGMDVADELEIIQAEFAKIDTELNELTTEINDIVSAEKAEFDAEIADLTAQQETLDDNCDFLEQKTSEKGAEFNALQEKIGGIKGGKKFSVNALVKNGIKGGAALGVNTIKGVAKSGLKQIDPLKGVINKGDVGDTGMESIRFARQGIEKTAKGIKTAQKTIKTTARGIKTAKNAVKHTVKTTYKVAEKAVKAAVFMAKLAVKAVTHIAAAAMNPITWIIAGILLVVVIISAAVVILMGGAGGSNSARVAGGAIGLEDVTGQYMQGVTFFGNSIESERNGFSTLIDATNEDDLIFMQLTRADGSVVNYNTALAMPWQTNFLQAMPWSSPNNSNLLDVNDTIAIAYVLLQRRANTDNGTSGQIYSVTFTQAIFDEIIALSVSYNTTVYPNQPCPGGDCHTETIETVVGQDDDGEDIIETEQVTSCTLHDLHAIGFWYHNADTVMTALGFTADDKQWAILTAAGFELNPNIP